MLSKTTAAFRMPQGTFSPCCDISGAIIGKVFVSLVVSISASMNSFQTSTKTKAKALSRDFIATGRATL